jgi:hypothetical protein
VAREAVLAVEVVRAAEVGLEVEGQAGAPVQVAAHLEALLVRLALRGRRERRLVGG